MNIEVVILKVNMGFFINYSYIIYTKDSNKCIVVDPAHEFKKIDRVLKEKDLIPEALLLSHSHLDHVNLVNKMVKTYDSRVYISKIESDYYRYKAPNLQPFEIQGRYTNFMVGPLTVTAIHTPGHTKGSACYLIGNFLFTGDTVFVEGCGTCEGRGADPGEMFETFRYLLRVIPGSTRIMPGHVYVDYPGLDFEEVITRNIYFNIEEKDKFIEFRMRKNQKNGLNFNRNG